MAAKRKAVRRAQKRRSAKRPKRPKLRLRVSKRASRKAVSRRAVSRKARRVKVSRKLARRAPKMQIAKKREVYVGRVSHYFTRIGVGVIDLEKPLKEGDMVKIEGHTTNFRQRVRSLQLNHRQIKLARSGISVGLKVNERVRENDRVYRIE